MTSKYEEALKRYKEYIKTTKDDALLGCDEYIQKALQRAHAAEQVDVEHIRQELACKFNEWDSYVEPSSLVCNIVNHLKQQGYLSTPPVTTKEAREALEALNGWIYDPDPMLVTRGELTKAEEKLCDNTETIRKLLEAAAKERN